MTYEELVKANSEIITTDIKGKDYAEVNQRIKAFRMLHPDGCIHTDIISLENGICVIKATVSDADGKELGTGLAYEKEGSTFINKTSYIENCETSAVGRALGMVGIGVDTSIASYEEVSNAIAQQEEQKAAEKPKSTKPMNKPAQPKAEADEQKKAEEEQKKIENSKISEVKLKALLKRCADDHVDTKKLMQLYKVNSLADLTERQFANIHEFWEKIKG